MNTQVLLVAAGILIGLVIMGLLVWFTLPSMMVIKRRTDRSYDEALALLGEEIQKKQDWHLLKINDYQESTASFGSLEKVCSMNVCNPRYASRILTDDANRGVTAFMPLAIGIFEDKKGQVFLAQLNVSLLGLMFGGTIARVMKMAGADLSKAVAAISAR